VFFLFLLLASLSSCRKAEDRSCIKGSGPWSSVERAVPGLREVRLYDFIDYRFIQDSADKVVIHAGENLLAFVTTDYENGLLTIRNDNRCAWLRRLPVNIQVDIHFKKLDLVYNESAGTSTSLGILRQNEFAWQNWHTASKVNLEIEAEHAYFSTNAGNSLIHLSGEVNDLNLYLSGACEIEAKSLIAHQAFAHNVGSGDIELSVVGGVLYWNIESHGDIIYHGSPDAVIMYEHTGDGQLIMGE